MRNPLFPRARFPLVTLRLVVKMLAVAGLLAATGCATLSVAPPKPVTVGDVLHMTDDGVPPHEIIDRMRDSGTVYRLDASQLAHLKEQGVADPVINYMQRTYLDAVRRRQALATPLATRGTAKNAGNNRNEAATASAPPARRRRRNKRVW